MSDLERVLHDISNASSHGELWTVMLDHLHAAGVKIVSYHAVGPDLEDTTIVSDGFPEDWLKRYVSEKFVQIDPIPELASRTAEPFFWHDIRDLAPHSDSTDAYLEALETSQIGDGLALYVFGPGLHNAYIGLGFGVERIDLSKIEVFDLQCVVQAGHLRYCSLSAKDRTETLSQREIEVLRWIAQGKSNSVIGAVMQISPHTVDAHLRSIYRKLDVTDRTSAAIKGLGSGVIQYPHHATTS